MYINVQGKEGARGVDEGRKKGSWAENGMKWMERMERMNRPLGNLPG